jgi:hypothetical protein
MKTAVEQFAIALYEKGFLQGNGDEIEKLLNTFQEMEREQIKDAYNYGHTDGVNDKPGLTSGTIYYNETYGGGEQ